MLNWLGHVVRMRDERMAKKIYDRKMSGKRDRGRPVDSQKYSIKDAVGRSWLSYFIYIKVPKMNSIVLRFVLSCVHETIKIIATSLSL